MTHSNLHLFWTIGFLVAAFAATILLRNRAIKRRLLFAQLVLLAAIAIHWVVRADLPVLRDPNGRDIENILIAFGFIYAVVTLAFNPWYRERTSEEGTPAIVQDATVVGLTLISALFVFQNSSFFVGITGSAIVVGLALQDTLGNAFAGLAIQVDKPFHVGHWVSVANYEGRVVEVTWRATKIKTKSGNLVVLPNSVVAKEPINNYSEPAAPTRLSVEVGASYLTPPNEVVDAILTAVRRVPKVLVAPGPDAFVFEFSGSAIVYRTRFWIDDFEAEERAKGAVRAAIYYEFHRRDIEIPWPITVEYKRQEAPRETPEMRDEFVKIIAAIPVMATLPVEAHRALAQSAAERLYASGEAVVREGDPGASMFVVRRGRVAITVGPEQREVAVTEVGGYFGEMSLLTGDPRTATVSAKGDCRVLEISAHDFRSYVQSNPHVIDQLAAASNARRRALDQTRASGSGEHTAETISLAQRMRRFFGLA